MITSPCFTVIANDFLLQQYGVQVNDDNQPLLYSRAREKIIGGQRTRREVLLVPEFCILTGA